MTANEERGVDLDAIETAMRYDMDWLADHGRSTARRLIAELRSTRAAVETMQDCNERQLRMIQNLRASIGPDSERIRGLEAKVERLTEERKSIWRAGYDEGIATMQSEWP